MKTAADLNHGDKSPTDAPPEPGVFTEALLEYRGGEGVLIPLLQKAQEQYSYISESAMQRIAAVTGIPLADIYGVVTFYTQFKLSPPGKNIIRVCDGTACHVNGSSTIIGILEDILGIKVDETTPDRLFTLQSVACLGCCSLAPVMVVNDETHGRLKPGDIREIIESCRNS